MKISPIKPNPELLKLNIRKINLSDAIIQPKNKPLKMDLDKLISGNSKSVVQNAKKFKYLKNALKTSTIVLCTALGLIGGALAGHSTRQFMARKILTENPMLAKLSVNEKNIKDFSLIFLNGRLKHLGSIFYFSKYRVSAGKGINYKTANNVADIVLAKNAERVASYFQTVGNCYTGTKHALLTSGIISDYGQMPLGSASNALEYFQKNPEKFQRVLKNGRKLTPKQLRELPAGRIVVYSKKGEHGHISITNGNGQGMSDSFDNMMWIEEKGQGADFEVFKLTDGWRYNPQTRKLDFISTK